MLSGMAALIMQMVWSRQLAFIVGASAPAVALVLALFMLGLALGARLAGLRAHRVNNRLRAFALLEAAGGLWALLSIKLLGLLTLAYQLLGGGYGVRVLVAALLVLPATLLWGAGLPLLAAEWAERRGESSRTTGILYGINTAGAALGAFTAAYLLLPAYGFRITLLTAAMIDVTVGIAAWLLGGRSARPAPHAAEQSPAAPLPGRWIAALLLIGFSSFATEVILTRVFILQWSSAVFAFAAVLVIVLIGTALGGFIGGGLAAKHGGEKVLGIALALAALSAPWIVWQCQSLSDFTRLAARTIHPTAPWREGLMLLIAAAPIALPGVVLAGMAIPALVRTPDGAGADLGRIYFYNTLGNVAGAALAGFVLIPRLGTQSTLFLGGWCYGAAALLIGAKAGGSRRFAPPIVAAAGLALCQWLAPPLSLITSSEIFRTAGFSHRVLREGVNGTALLSTITQRVPGQPVPDEYLSLEVNGVNVAGTTPDNYSIQKLQGHLPLFFHPDPKTVLHIGIGSGGTAHSVSTHDVDSITVAEIAPEVAQMARDYFSLTHKNVFADPRLKFIYNDGRNVLLASPKRYDAILSDSVHPRLAGNGSLYTAEYFQLLKSRLNDGGVASMWLPAYTLRPEDFRSIVSGFCASFNDGAGDVALFYNHATQNQFTVVIGRRQGRLDMDLARLGRLLARPEVKADLALIGRDRPEALLSDYMTGGDTLCRWAGAAAPMSDDRLQAEYLSGLWSLEREAPWWDSFDALMNLRESPAPRFVNDSPAFITAFEREWEAAEYNLQGQRLAGGGNLAAAQGDRAGAKRRYDAAQTAFNSAWSLSPAMAEPVEITRKYGFPRALPPEIAALPEIGEKQ